MYFKLKSNVIFRNYQSFGYITDNRNFGYKQANNDKDDIGDRIVSQSGSVFLSTLTKEPQTLDALAKEINMQFTDVDVEIIKNDAREFYLSLELEGFIVSGETLQECNKKDFNFSYEIVKPSIEQFNCSLTKTHKKSTQEFFEQHFNGKFQLTNVYVEITSKCNENCVHCYIPYDRKLNNIDPIIFFDILEQCREMNLLHITLSGGEPLMHHSFLEFLKKCNEYNFSVNVLSNLTLLNEDIVEEMKRNPLLSVQTSLYSMDSNIHDEITQTKGSFEKTKNAILKLKENNIPLQISCPIIKRNLLSYKDVIYWGKTHNISVGSDYIIISKYNNSTQNLSNRLSLNDVKKVIQQKIIDEPTYLQLLQKEAEEKKNITPDNIICSVCHSTLCISENGNVYPCAGWQGYVVGNVKKNKLNEIWNNSKKVQYLRTLRKRDIPECVQCSEKEFCTICLVRNANENPLGNPLIVNEYFCNVAKINKEIILRERCKATL